jgi:feruloyl esterase
MEKNKLIRFWSGKLFSKVCDFLGVVIILFCAVPLSVQSQPFEDLDKTINDYSKADISPAKSCNEIGTYKADEIVNIAAEKIPADGATPGFCRVKGMFNPEIQFEVNLPEKWNGRFFMFGNGGHAGEALDDPMRISQVKQAINNGFAVAQTNTGHDTKKEPGASFVMSNPQKAIDYAYRAVHITAVTGKAIAKEYYATPVKFSYWNSCSNGGRQGLIEAQRYPEDFDGIVATAPWIDQTGFTIGAIWNQKH